MSERSRIERIYRRYADTGRYGRCWGPGPGKAYMEDRRWQETSRLLSEAGFEAGRARVLDVGAAEGDHVGRFLDLGCRLESVVCVDLLLESVRGGKKAHPRVPFMVADAIVLPFRNEQFDLVHQSVMVSSSTDRKRRAGIAAEMHRVTRRGGQIVWYDVRYPNPFNLRIRPIAKREVREWFPECRGEILSITLIPQVARALAPLSTHVCRLLETIPLLRSHLLAVLTKA